MRRLLFSILLVFCFTIPVNALDFTAPEAPPEAERYMPDTTDSFWRDLIYVVKSVLKEIQPSVSSAAQTCLSVIVIVLLMSLLQAFTVSEKNITSLIGTLMIGTLLIKSTNSLINLGADTVKGLTDYGKLLLPVMTTALAAQGGVTTSAALYAGTSAFVTVLSGAVSRLLVPLLYIFLCVCIANSAIADGALKHIRDFLKWLFTWCFKIVLYVFTGYMGITGVISGTTDAAAVKATKLTISGAVPVVGSIMADASETILVSAGLMKNAAGVYGLITLFAILAGPFLKIGVHYLILKIATAVCGSFADKNTGTLISDFSTGMGFVLAMTGTASLLLMVSIVCFMKGVS